MSASYCLCGLETFRMIYDFMFGFDIFKQKMFSACHINWTIITSMEAIIRKKRNKNNI